MTTPEDIASRVLTLSDAELFGPARAPLDDRELALLDESFEGVALAGAARVELAARDRLPVVVASCATARRAWEVSREASTVLAAMDLDRREVFLGRPLRDTKLEEYPPGDLAPPPPPTGDSVAAWVTRHDARAALELPWRPSRLRLVAICDDWASNVIDVELAGDAVAPPGRARTPSPVPSDGGASYMRRPSGLADPGPGAPDLELELIRDAQGALRLAGSVVWRADAAHIPSERLEVADGGASHVVAAVLPITFLFTEPHGAGARVDLDVPAYGAAAAAPGQAMHASFVVTLPFAPRRAVQPVHVLSEGRVALHRLAVP